MQLLEYSILQFLVHPRVRDAALTHFKIEFFKTDEGKAFFTALSSNGYKDRIPDVASFAIELHRVPNVTEVTIGDCLTILKGADVNYSSEDEINFRLKSIEDFIRTCMLTKSIFALVNSTEQLNVGDPKHYQPIIEASSFSIVGDEFCNLSVIDSFEKAKIDIFPAGGIIVKSKYSVVNNNLSYKGYKYGDLICVGAETGVGKTTVLVNEGANFLQQGFKVCHVFLGDMEVFDAGVQYLSCLNDGVLVNEIVAGYERFYTQYAQSMFQNLRIQAYPSDAINVYELIAKLKSLKRKFRFDVLIVDYDANLKEISDSMYKEGGTTYAQLKGFGKGSHVTLIASQIKPAYWGQEILPKEALNESSKKQMHLDLQLMLGRNPDCRMLGTMNIAKVRRGQDGVKFCMNLKYHYGRMEEISEEQYKTYLDTWKQRDHNGELNIDFSDKK